MPYFVLPLIVGVVIQILKMGIDYIHERKILLNNFWRAGGFPSVHSALSSSVTTLIALTDGLNSSLFALAFILSFLFWYDAMNVRYEAGNHAKVINQISVELQDVLLSSEHHKYLKERLGHTLYEVVGGIVLGSLLTIYLYQLFY